MESAQKAYDMQSDDRDDDEEAPQVEPPEDINQIETLFVRAGRLYL